MTDTQNRPDASEVFSVEEIAAAIRKLYEVAMTGDVEAMRTLFDLVTTRDEEQEQEGE
jgi:hypothetical protein